MVTEFVTPHYAAHWRTIGIQLHITCGKLDAIEQEHPRDTFTCCDKMLGIWLEGDENASWQQLIATIISFKRVRAFHKKGVCTSYVHTIFIQIEAQAFISYKWLLTRRLYGPLLHFTWTFISFRVLDPGVYLCPGALLLFG